ncbi:MAG: DUF3592 domain-containing protein [Chthoniobacter sp.]|nr:DUF3592 domain-containing protein [Chthoniobacter sp.]
MNSASNPSGSTPQTVTPRRRFPRSAFAIFLVIGAGVLYFATIRPWQQIAAARNWKETPCTIASSRVVQSGSMAHGMPTYRIDIFYHYTVNGIRYGTNRYQFASGASSGQADKQRVVDQYPPGRETVCYVNPDSPSQAVLSRSLNGEMLYGLIGVVFLIIGAVGLFYSKRPAST